MSGAGPAKAVFPKDLLRAVPPEYDDMGTGSYLAHLCSDHPKFFQGALVHAHLEDLWDVVNDVQFRMDLDGLSQLRALTNHAACDFSLALEVLNYVEVSYYATKDPAELEDAFQQQSYQLVRTLTDRLNNGAFAFSSEDRTTTHYMLQHYQDSVPAEGGWRLSPELFEEAMRHAERLEHARKNKPKPKLSFEDALKLVQETRRK